MKVVTPKDFQWYQYITEGIVTSIYDSTALKSNSADYDGDEVASTSNFIIRKNARKQKANTIYNIDYVDPCAKEIESKSIDDMKEIIDCDIRGMSNDIGEVVNCITKLWSIEDKNKKINDEGLTVMDCIKIMSIVGSKTIDYVKHGVKAEIPKKIKKFVDGIKKPNFQKVIYKSNVRVEKNINNNNKILGKEKVRLFNNNDCTMNRLYDYMEQQIKDIKLDITEDAAFKFTDIYDNKNINIRSSKSYKLIEKMMFSFIKDSNEIAQKNSMENESKDCNNDDMEQEHIYKWTIFYNHVRTELMNLLLNKNLKLTKDKLLDYVIYIFYENKEFIKHNDDKSLLWNVFGNELNVRLHGEKLRQTKEYTEEEIEKKLERAEKLKNRVKKIKEQSNKVYIKDFAGDLDVKINTKIIRKVRRLTKDTDEKRLLTVLYVISQFSKTYNKKEIESKIFSIEASSKNKITKSNIQTLARIDDRKYKKLMKRLNDNKIITINTNKNGTILKIKINIECDEEDNEVLKDINKCKSLFKYFR